MLRQLEQSQRKPSPMRSPTHSPTPFGMDISFRPIPRKKKADAASGSALVKNDRVVEPPHFLQKSHRQTAVDASIPSIDNRNQQTVKEDDHSSSLRLVCRECQNVASPIARDMFCTRCRRVISWDAVRQALSHEQQWCEL